MPANFERFKLMSLAVPLAAAWLVTRSGFPADAPSVRLIAGKKTVAALIARTKSELERGLFGATNLEEDRGMLFILPKQGRTQFHLGTVPFPLSIAYLDGAGRILKIEHMDPRMAGRLYTAPEKTRFALEMNQGWFERSGLKEGDRIKRSS